MSVSQLGYIGIGVTDMDAWIDTAQNIIGWQVDASDDDSGTVFCRMDDMHHRFALHPSDRDDVLYAGWKVETDAQFESIIAALGADGAPVTVASDEKCAARRVQKMVTFKDPEGYENELYLRPLSTNAPFQPSLPISGFVTGDLGIGHVVRHCSDHARMVAFYRDILGFRVSDHILAYDMDATFMRCNRRHHSVAILSESLGRVGGQTNHVMVEVGDIDDVGRAYDEVLRRGLEIEMTLGRHGNDDTISFYFVGPSGFGIEIGTGALLVDDASWIVKTFNATKKWGHLLPHERGE